MAQDPPVIAGTETARKTFAESQTAMEDMLAAFDFTVRELQGGGQVSEAEVMKRLAQLSQVRTRFIEEVKQYEKHVLEANGLVASAPLDFDGLRDQIGGRLDRIRAAHGSDGLSGEPDAG